MVSFLYWDDPEFARTFRFIKRAMLAKVFGRAGTGTQPGKVIMVTSAMPGAGKSTVAANLAISIAQDQLINVVLIDADTVRRNLSEILGLRESDGLLEVLSTHDIQSGIRQTDLPNLSVIPAGQIHDDATELLASVYMSEILATITKQDSIVILDTTPLLVSSVADAISAHASHSIIVVEAGNTVDDEIEKALQILKRSGTSISFIMNKVKFDQRSGPSPRYELY